MAPVLLSLVSSDRLEIIAAAGGDPAVAAVHRCRRVALSIYNVLDASGIERGTFLNMGGVQHLGDTDVTWSSQTAFDSGTT